MKSAGRNESLKHNQLRLLKQSCGVKIHEGTIVLKAHKKPGISLVRSYGTSLVHTPDPKERADIPKLTTYRGCSMRRILYNPSYAAPYMNVTQQHLRWVLIPRIVLK